MPNHSYRRLVRDRNASLSMRSGLWLGSDHLLQVDTSGFTETYKRYHFKDIQAISVLKTKRMVTGNIVLSIFSGIFAAWMLAMIPRGERWTEGLTEGETTLGILLGVSIGLLVWNLVKGPTCQFWVKTAVQKERVGAVGRVRQARRILDRIRPLIATAQGQLTAEEVSARLQASMQPTPTSEVPPVI